MSAHDAGAVGAWVAAVFAACGVRDDDAATAARVLTRTSLRGIDTHGLARVPAYVGQLRSGAMAADARPTLAWRDGALAVDGGGGLGQVVASAAVDQAVRRSEHQAAVACAIGNSGHLAALGLFVLAAAERGRLAFLCQKTPPLMALPGSAAPAIGNNPIAFAAPLGAGPPLVFDIANSVVARGNVVRALDEGEPIPLGWAVGPDGLPTSDPALALRGAMLPSAGHKGIGMAMLVECLAGGLSAAALSGAAAAAAASDARGSAGGVSAFLLVVNPELFVGRAAFDASMEAWLATYLGATGPAGRYPGQRQASCERERLAAGIPVSETLHAELGAIGASVGEPFPAPR